MRDHERFFEGKRVLITGGLGFIGSNLAHKMVSLHTHVTLVDSLIPHYGGNIHSVRDFADQVTVNIADVRDIYSMNYLVQKQDYIFNLAGQVSHIMSMADPFPDLEINCKAQLTLLEACRRNNPEVKIIFAGTRGQYGKPRFLPVNEKHPLNPVDVNGINKTAGEMYHILYNHIYGIRAASLRLTNTYGPRHTMKNSDQSFLNWFVRLAMDAKTIPIFGDGQQKRDFNYIDDAIEAFLLIAASDGANGEVFNLGGPKPVSILDVTRMLLEITGKGRYELVPYPEERKKIEIGEYWGDYTKIQKLFGWEPKVSLEEGIRKTVEFYLQNKQFYWN